MKKVIVSILLAISTISCICSCEANAKPKYYTPHPWFYDVEEEEPLKVRSTTPTDKQQSICTEIFEKLTSFYGLEKEPPTIKITTQKLLAKAAKVEKSLTPMAVYLGENIIVISEEVFESSESKAMIAHEMCHYLSDNDGKYGLYYEKNNHMFGNVFDEGITNWISSNVYPYQYTDEDVMIYTYETHIASMLAIAFGKEKLAKSYFNSDIESLMEDFNNSVRNYYPIEQVDKDGEVIELSPFDVFTATITAGNAATVLIAENTAYESLAKSLLNSLEETLLFYGDAKGVKEQMKEEIKHFLKTNSYFSEITDFVAMAK